MSPVQISKEIVNGRFEIFQNFPHMQIYDMTAEIFRFEHKSKKKKDFKCLT